MNCSVKMIKMKPLSFLLFLMLALTACGSSQEATKPSIIVTDASAPPLQTASPQMENPLPTAQSGQDSDNSIPATSTALFLTIRQPLDESAVNTEQVEVIGEAPPDTVVTVNDEILIVGPEQEFTVSISLEEGPNLIEIVASDFAGNETSQLLTVYYEP
jgi:predicted component of type VI protein secretion system